MPTLEETKQILAARQAYGEQKEILEKPIQFTPGMARATSGTSFLGSYGALQKEKGETEKALQEVTEESTQFETQIATGAPELALKEFTETAYATAKGKVESKIQTYETKLTDITQRIDRLSHGEKTKAIKMLENELNWKNYGGKHYESVYTRFYQGYFLPVKFNIDKRRGHLSDLIQNKQISREEALGLIKEKPYNDESLLKEDIDFMLKKLGLKEDTFQKILQEPPRTFLNFKNSEKQITFLKNIVNDLRKRRIISK